MATQLGYRPSVGIMLLNGDGKVWIGRRIDRDKEGFQYDGGNWWQMPQGGIDGSETPEAAVLRELFEETGIRADRVEVLQKTIDWLAYDLPEPLIGKICSGRYRGQQQIWFAMRFTGQDDEINIGAHDGVKAEFDAWRWENASELGEVVVPFKRKLYKAVLSEFEGLTRVG